MKKLLVIGKPVHGFVKELEDKMIGFDMVDNILDFCVTSEYRIVIVFGFDLLLNQNQLQKFCDLMTRIPVTTTTLFWNHEPFWDFRKTNVEFWFGREIYFFNAYNASIYISPMSMYFGVGNYMYGKRVKNIEMPSKDFLKDRFYKSWANSKPVCAYATCFNDFRNNVPSSLVNLRNNIIKKFHDNKLCDVYGKGWNGTWSLDIVNESRAGAGAENWAKIKVENSKYNYSFSICIENSLIPNYVTEKFGHALESHLLPIYVFGNGLENYIDKNLAIAVDFDDINYDSVLDLVKSIDFEEYYFRLHGLTESYNDVISKIDYVNCERSLPAKKLIDFVSCYIDKSLN